MKYFRGKKSNLQTTIESDNGKLLIMPVEQLIRCREYFRDILGTTDANRSTENENNENVEPLRAKTLPINCDVPTKTEIQRAIKQKSPI